MMTTAQTLVWDHMHTLTQDHKGKSPKFTGASLADVTDDDGKTADPHISLGRSPSVSSRPGIIFNPIKLFKIPFLARFSDYYFDRLLN